LPDGKTDTVRAVFEELFKRHGLPQAMRSDNGPPFASSNGLLGLSRLSAWWLSLGIELERSRPGCPQDNGAHERMHKDIAREIEALSSSRAVQSTEQRQALFDVWREEFNQRRPHEALAMKRPADVYERSARSYNGQAPELAYDGMETRRVQQTGRIKYGAVSYSISSALGGQQVGLKGVSENRYEVHYARLLLGHLEVETESFKPVEQSVQEDTQDGGTQAPPICSTPPSGLKKPVCTPLAHTLKRNPPTPCVTHVLNPMCYPCPDRAPLLPAPCSLLPAPCSLLPAPCSLLLAPLPAYSPMQ
jgi:hypothetical protein